jgi:hypothetical protein
MRVKTSAIESTATFSECERYRYRLHRRYWPVSERTINYLMLNPSTADAEWNDNTVAKCERIALLNGYSDMIITNLFAYRDTSPHAMMAAHANGGLDVIGDRNDQAIITAAEQADTIVCAWGNHGSYADRSKHVRELLEPYSSKLHCLALNQSQEPKHPLYVRDDAKPAPLPWHDGRV